MENIFFSFFDKISELPEMTANKHPARCVHYHRPEQSSPTVVVIKNFLSFLPKEYYLFARIIR
jgi:hypothetical protein